MSELHSSLEERLEQIAEEVRFLRVTVEDLAGRVGAPRTARPQAEAAPVWQGALDSEVRLQRATADLFTGTATVCFILVIALLLRTVADNGLINRMAGVVVGMVYALALVGVSYRRYARSQHLAHVYSVCGTLLLLSIVYESRTRFDLIPAPAAYALLAFVALYSLVLGMRHVTVTPMAVGFLGASLTGLLLDFPEPVFTRPAALLLVAGVASVRASRLPSGRWLKWVSFGFSAVFWFYWTAKVRAPLLRGQDPEPTLSLSWFFPYLAAYALAYTGIALKPLFRKTGKHTLFETILPVSCAIGAYLVARAVLPPLEGSLELFGYLGVLVAAAYLLQAIHFAAYGPRTMRPATAFTAGSVALWLLALPWLGAGDATVALLWSLSSLGFMILAWKWRNHDVALLACVVQLVACITAFSWQVLPIHRPLPISSLPAAVALGLVCFILYAACRRIRRAHVKVLGLRFDPSRRAAVTLLLAGLVCEFTAARIALLWTLAVFGVADGDEVVCAQSVLVNGGALVVAGAGLFLASGEILAVALLIALLGALKVFGGDLLQIRGLPLIFSVMSFGVTAAIGSMIWSRWQRQKADA